MRGTRFMKENSRMDEWMRSRLQNLAVKYDPATWEMLELRMDATIPSFDETIADKLSNVEVNSPASGWEAMEMLLDIEDATETIENDVAVDSIVYEKLANYSAPLRESHWKRMAQRLESEFVLRRRILQQKTAELILMALLLLALIRFEPLWTTSDRPVAVNQSPQTQNFGLLSQAESEIYQPKDESSAGKQTANTSPVISPENTSENTQLSNDLAALDFATFSAKRIQAPSRLALKAMGQLAYASNESIPTVNIEGSAAVTDFDLLANDFDNVESQTISALILPKGKKIQAPLEIRFSLLGTVDYNIVTTPADRFEFQGTQIRTEEDTTAASGYGGGILVDFKRNRWAIQTGGIYSNKRYIPNTPVLLFQTVDYYVKEDFHGIQKDILEIPLTLNYYFKNTGNWRMYGGIGIAGHFITSSIYEFRYSYTPTFNLAAPTPPAEGETPSLKEEKNFPEGLLDGGRLSDNFYLTANLGLGIERYLTGRTSVFLQPNYQHYLLDKGIGTNRDKFYTFSLSLGARVGLK